eukprot:2292051-Pyramimonas_sp.AAC.1
MGSTLRRPTRRLHQGIRTLRRNITPLPAGETPSSIYDTCGRGQGAIWACPECHPGDESTWAAAENGPGRVGTGLSGCGGRGHCL